MRNNRKHGWLGKAQVAILRTVAGGDWFSAPNRSVNLSCLKLHDHGFLRRDPINSHRWTSTPEGIRLIQEHDKELQRRKPE